VGFCHTARTVLVSMADHPDEFAAGSIMHPSFVVTEGPESVHLVAGRIRGPIYAGFGAADRSAPLATQQPLIDELSRDGVPAKIEIHPGADHGYGFTGTPSFDQEAAERSWKGALDVLGRALAPND
jgi:carboxymethylenebutenolidase